MMMGWAARHALSLLIALIALVSANAEAADSVSIRAVQANHALWSARLAFAGQGSCSFSCSGRGGEPLSLKLARAECLELKDLTARAFVSRVDAKAPPPWVDEPSYVLESDGMPLALALKAPAECRLGPGGAMDCHANELSAGEKLLLRLRKLRDRMRKAAG